MYRKLAFIGVILLAASCAAFTPENPWVTTPENPWVTPDKEHTVLDDTIDEINSLMQPCIIHARDTFPEAVHRFNSGLPSGTELLVIVRDDQEFNVYVGVNAIEGSRIHGRSATGGSFSVNGLLYSTGQKISISARDIVDWYIIKPDQPPDGNLLGKYILLREDGLAPGACDPDFIETQHNRIYRKYYSFVPPSDEGWQMPRVAKDSRVSMKNVIGKPNQAYEFFAAHTKAQVYASTQSLADSTLEMEKSNLEAYDPIKILRHDVVPYENKKTNCVRMHQHIELEKFLPAGFGNQGPMSKEILTLKCIQPRSQNMAIWLVYSHFYQPGYRNPEFDNQAEKVFESLGFTGQNTNARISVNWWR